MKWNVIISWLIHFESSLESSRKYYPIQASSWMFVCLGWLDKKRQKKSLNFFITQLKIITLVLFPFLQPWTEYYPLCKQCFCIFLDKNFESFLGNWKGLFVTWLESLFTHLLIPYDIRNFIRMSNYVLKRVFFTYTCDRVSSVAI